MFWATKSSEIVHATSAKLSKHLSWSPQGHFVKKNLFNDFERKNISAETAKRFFKSFSASAEENFEQKLNLENNKFWTWKKLFTFFGDFRAVLLELFSTCPEDFEEKTSGRKKVC